MPLLWGLNLIQSPKIWWYMCSHLIRPQMNWFLLSEPCFAGDSDQSVCICLSIDPSIRDHLNRAYLLSPWPNLTRTSTTEYFGKGYAGTFNQVSRSY